MQLTRHTDYSLRVLMYLAIQNGERLVTMREIVEHFYIPHNHLIKIVQRMARHGFVQTVRGKGGGMRLGMPVSTLTVGTVVRAMEPNLEPVNCQSPGCPLLSGCELRPVLDEARDAFIDVLDRYTIADLAARPQRLHGLLRLKAG